ncbi:MAG: arginine--tRNA ligase [Ectothiorhodospiraceae bacterium]|jgi:arginyl-tRNA synthetase
MKHQLAELVQQALAALVRDGLLPADPQIDVQIERGRGKEHGDFATNTAMRLAKTARRPPREIAQAIVDALPAHEYVERVEIAGPGFINFFLSPAAAFAVVRQIWDEGEAFGRGTVGEGKRILVEYVSANPTGPLHVGHGRGAAFGSSLSNLLAAAGFDVEQEYYVNDAGRQMDILAVSILLRYLEALGEPVRFPDNGYRGDYIRDIAADLKREAGDRYRVEGAELMRGLPADASDGGDKEKHVDALVAKARAVLGADDYRAVLRAGLDAILGDIQDDLAGFGVHHDRYFSEQSLVDSGRVQETLDRLQEGDHLYERDGALWFRSSDFGDDKDRVVRRADGQTTYFASDIAYHRDKLERGFDQAVDVFGADHHGYMERVRASMEAFGYSRDRLEFRLVQFAILYRGSERLQMSTRSGEFVTLRALREEVGGDAARFFYVMRKPEQHLDFDLELAKSQSSDNPVYYIQYAHARICSVMAQLAEKGAKHNLETGLAALPRLQEEHETALVSQLSRYPEVIEASAVAHEPHQVAHYLRELANAFHTYYNAHPFLVDDAGLRDARLTLILATRQVLRNGLAILGVSAPESM